MSGDFTISWDTSASVISTSIYIGTTANQIVLAKTGLYIINGGWYTTDSATNNQKTCYIRAFNASGTSYDSGFRYGFCGSYVYGCTTNCQINVTSANSYVVMYGSVQSSTAIGAGSSTLRTWMQISGPYSS